MTSRRGDGGTRFAGQPRQARKRSAAGGFDPGPGDLGRAGGWPAREDARQGALGDAGLIAVLGAVAHHVPEQILRRVVQGDDGNYRVLVDQARCTATGAVPTGQVVEMAVTPVLPVYDHSPGEPAYAKADGSAWAAIAEKALAGIDAAWTTERRARWAEAWAALCAADATDPAVANPRRGRPPTGYTRLGQGSTAWDCAEFLTQLTGRQAAVRRFPARSRRTRRLLRRQLADHKPVIVTSRSAGPGDVHRYRLVPAHTYEITAAGWRGIILRNPWGFADPRPVPAGRVAAVLRPEYATLA